jgi:tetratricopeptide (TPR) repeat protein
MCREAKMMRRFAMLTAIAVAALWLMPAAFAQATGSVKGVCKDTQGNPIDGATVEWYSPDTGRKYELQCKKGQYFSLGISPGKYTVKLTQNGKELFHFTNVPVSVDESTLDFNLQKEMSAQAQAQGMSAEELKKRQEQQEKVSKENANVRVLNDKLAMARTDMQTGNYDHAITTLNEANQIDPTRDVLWASLADAYRASAAKQTDPAEKTKRYQDAADNYQKAIQIKQNAEAAPGAKKDPNAGKALAGYYNNLADALAKAGKIDDAVKAYDQAAQTDPAGAGTYYFNEGAIMTNNGNVDAAVAAFDKAIAADPTKAEAYYWKGVNLIAKATTDKQSGKVIPAPGTGEALNKYLELQPTGQFADAAKGMLQTIGSKIETSYGKKKASKK